MSRAGERCSEVPSVPEDVVAEIRNTFGRVAYTHKTHEKEAERQRQFAARIKLANVAVIGITASAAVLAPLLASAFAAWAAAASAILALVFAAFQLSFDPAGEANAHILAAKSYLALRNDYRRLIADLGDLDPAEIRANRDRLARTLDHLDRAAPPTSPKAYEQARKALQGAEELTFTEDEYRHLVNEPTSDPAPAIDTKSD